MCINMTVLIVYLMFLEPIFLIRMYINITEKIQIIFIKYLQELIMNKHTLIIKGIAIWNHLSSELAYTHRL